MHHWLPFCLVLLGLLPACAPPPAMPPASMNSNMMLIRGETYTMGDVMGDNLQTDETPHTVTVGSFYLSKYEVTFDEFDAFCAATNRESPRTTAGAAAAARSSASTDTTPSNAAKLSLWTTFRPTSWASNT